MFVVIMHASLISTLLVTCLIYTLITHVQLHSAAQMCTVHEHAYMLSVIIQLRIYSSHNTEDLI